MEGLNFVPFAIAPQLCKGGSFTLLYLLSHQTFGGIGDASGSATFGVQKPGSRQFVRCPGKGTSDQRCGDSNLPVEIVRSQPQLRGLQWSENHEESARQRLRPPAVLRPRAYPVSLTFNWSARCRTAFPQAMPSPQTHSVCPDPATPSYL